jgi:glycosyltransferase involved in cell wall biosynthesis
MKEVSIILNSFNPTLFHAQMTKECLAAIRKFTDREDYELIVIDNAPASPITDEYDVLKLHEEKYVRNEVDVGVCGSYNQGAKLAEGKYLVFIQSDVFVTEGWLPNLIWYLKNGWDVAYPHQINHTREDIKFLYECPFDAVPWGYRDAGLLMITKEGFDKTGGWNERLKILQETDFYQKIDNAGLKWTCQTKSVINHICAGTNFSAKPREQFDVELGEDRKILDEEVK